MKHSALLIVATLFLSACQVGQQAPPEISASDISHRANDLPPPIERVEPATVVIELETQEVVSEIAPGVTYEYWTYNGTVPGPFFRVREGDTVEVRLTHAEHGHGNDAHASGFPLTVSYIPTAEAAADDHTEDDQHGHTSPSPFDDDNEDGVSGEHAQAGHGTHSIDLHAVIGPGGGATLTQTTTGATRVFRFQANHPGIYVYHCASPHIPTHIANGMYGMILVEPKEGLPPVEKEFYVMQGDFYTEGAFGERGHQAFSKEKLLKEEPDYFLFNGRVGALTGDRALTADVGDTIRVFFGVGSHIGSNFHVIGGIFDHLYAQGDLLSPPLQNVQTTFVPPGSAVMVEMTLDVPGTYTLVDHSLTRAVDKGAIGELVVRGEDRPDLFRSMATNPDPNHTHADFAIYVRGEKLDFSDARFMAGEGGDDHEEHDHTHDTMHLHDDVGHVIHRHKPGQTLGDFLDSIGFAMTETCLATDSGPQICNGGGATWKMFVNGGEVAVNADYVFADEDQILLTFGASTADVREQLQKMTDDACLYSKTCPERGEPPAENCVADPAVPCTAPLEDF